MCYRSGVTGAGLQGRGYRGGVTGAGLQGRVTGVGLQGWGYGNGVLLKSGFGLVNCRLLTPSSVKKRKCYLCSIESSKIGCYF